MVSELNQWLIPAPIIIIERPLVSIAFCANSLATCVTNSCLIPVTFSCHAGVYLDSLSS